MSRISIKDFSQQHGLLKPTVFKVLKRLGIEPSKSRGDSQSRGQMVSYITEDESRQVLEALVSPTQAIEEGGTASELDAHLYDVGVFYLLSLEPECDPTRFKVGFTNDLDERLRTHRCSAPFATVVKIWPCRRL
jgi:hypothetical protein